MIAVIDHQPLTAALSIGSFNLFISRKKEKKKTSVAEEICPSYKINLNQREDEATVAYNNMRGAIESRGIIPAHFR